MSEAREQIKRIQKAIKSRCKSLHVRNGTGTAWGWVEISGSGSLGGNFTDDEKNALRELGLPFGANFAVISPEDRKWTAEKLEEVTKVKA